ncbi:MAG: hypothetical protein OXB98_09575 [Bryobacterales bacterium]|nr:hypothetical protein [Bryobacterales bacterium]
MNLIVPRTCTEIVPRDGDQNQESGLRSLKEFRSAAACVLLGDPGSGKTEAFKAESKALGERALKITARDFLTLNLDRRPEWRNKTLFIDGLDEIRAGAPDARTPFDQVRRRLDKLGRPRFRLSCRAADWLEDNDRRHLESVSQDSKVTVLRLDPLTDSDVIRIVNDRLGDGDAQEFITKARERGVEGLLRNPQSLTMLADVVDEGGSWPKSRLETFEKACSKMVREHNEEHQLGGQPYRPDQLMDAAGRLCAVQLLAGTAGYSLRHNDAGDDYPLMDACNYGSPETLRQALSTKLFKSASNNRFEPVHRHIAEFLGSRHLARLIGEGLPARRVLALMTGGDGIVVTEMRGLSAWLAAQCSKARADLIDRDPIGVGLYGDIVEFSHDEKRALLEALSRGIKALSREGYRLGSVLPAAAPFGPLATPDMEFVLEELLTSSSRSRDHQLLVEFILRVLGQGEALQGLSRILLEIVRDDTWWPRINVPALDAFIHLHNSQDKTGDLKMLLADIRSGSVSDPINQLLGTLLTQLYPRELPPQKVWDYLSGIWDRRFFPRYCVFWDTGLILKSSPEDLAELLDSLAEWLPRLRSALDAHYLHGLTLDLLAAGLEARGDEIETRRLYDWLSVSLWDQDLEASSDGRESIRQIRSWLEQRPEIQKKIIVEGLDRCPETDEFRYHASGVQQRLYDAIPPHDFGLWCLEQSVATADTKPQVAEYLLKQAVKAHKHRSGNEGLSLEVLQEHVRENEKLRTSLDRLIYPPPTPPKHRDRDTEQILEKHKQRKQQRLDAVRSNLAALRENRAAPALLYRMAREYFGNFFKAADGPNAIKEWLQGDRDLIDAALLGLRGVVDREDVPDIDETLELREKGQIHYLGMPFLAGLEEIERTAPENPSRWDDGRIRKAIGFYYCTPHENYRPRWYLRLLLARPEIVAGIQVRFAVSEFRSGSEHIYKLWELAHDRDHAGVARQASLPLLRAFPTRCALKQIESLDCLLWAAIQHADRRALQELIDRKLSRKSMNDAQRVHWLAAGFAVLPETYIELLEDFIKDQEHRIHQLSKFFCPEDSVRFSFDGLGVPGMELLIRLVGSYAGPAQRSEQGWSSPKLEASDFVDKLIQSLAASPSKDASKALGSLHADRTLHYWRDVLAHAKDAQRVIRRDAGYRHPKTDQICRTLDGGKPANAGDLAALVSDRLCDLAVKIRTGNTDDWRQYWNEKPCTPRHENFCRDALLSDLRERFPEGVDAQPEGQYARDRRADIRVSGEDFQVPIEVKKNGHRDLWSAMKNQLIKQYASDPATDGYGIYLVFWFGKTCTQPPPSGPRPDSPQELQTKLEATLSEDLARKITVCVIDVSGDS